MKLREILQDPELSGLKKGFVYYLEAQKYIKPQKIQHGQVKRRDYSLDDLRLIKQMWTYHEHGISPARASTLLNKSPPEIPKIPSPQRSFLAFILLIYQSVSPAKETKKILRALRKIKGVQEVAGVYGNVDIIVKVEVDSLPSLYELVHAQIASATGLKDTRSGTLIVIDSQFHWDHSKEFNVKGKTLAFILFQALRNHTYSFLNKLKDFHEVLEAAVVYGEADIIAKVAVKDLAELTTLTRQKFLTLPGIGKVTTFVVPDPAHHLKLR
jgi:DNA-binding Lrp family transcriptional regulator